MMLVQRVSDGEEKVAYSRDLPRKKFFQWEMACDHHGIYSALP